jgi:hypothetical protein
MWRGENGDPLVLHNSDIASKRLMRVAQGNSARATLLLHHGVRQLLLIKNAFQL